MIQVNLLPWRKQKQQTLFKQAILIFVVCLVTGITLIAFVTGEICNKNQIYFQTIQEKKRQHQMLLFAINQIKTEQHTFDLMSELLKKSTDLKQRSDKIVQLLFLLIQWLPEQVWLNKVSIHQLNLLIEGGALNYPSIINFAAFARGSCELENIDIVDVSHQKSYQSTPLAHLKFKLEALWR